MGDPAKFTFGNGGEFQLVDSASNNISNVFSMFDFGKENIGDSPDHSQSRKRKVDKDGFVHPTTPDIPKTSSQYDRNQGDVAGKFSDLFCLSESPNESVDSETTAPQFVEGPNEDDETSSETRTLEQQSPYFGGSIPEPAHIPDQPDPAGDRCRPRQSGTSESVDTLLKGFGQEIQSMYENWGKTFQMSEGFEELCPQRLDMYIQEALEIEKNLTRQKDVLCHRLRGLGNTLQM